MKVPAVSAQPSASLTIRPMRSGLENTLES